MPRNGQHFRDRPNVIRVLDDEKKQALFLDEFNLEVPSVGVLDAPYRCYAINHQWAKIIMGFVGWLATIAVWDGAEDESHDGVVGVLKFLSQSGVCNMLQVRQSPTEPCILEFSEDEGSSWSEFADILDCVTPTFLENSIINALNTNTTIQQIIDNLVDGGTDNDLPSTPTISQPDLLCDSAYYVTDKIIDFIDQTLTDASTITLEEFITGLLGLGGFDGSLLVLFWDLIVASSYPDLLTDVQDSRDEIAKILYCNELDKDLSTLEVDASVTIGAEAQAAIIGAINAVTDGKWSLWAFVGSQVDSGEDCSLFCDTCETYDFTIDDQGWIPCIFSVNTPRGQYVSGEGWNGNPSTIPGQAGCQLDGSFTINKVTVTLDMPITGAKQWLLRLDDVNKINVVTTGQTHVFDLGVNNAVTDNVQVLAIDNSVLGSGGGTQTPYKIVSIELCGIGTLPTP